MPKKRSGLTTQKLSCGYDVLRSDDGTVFCYTDLRLREFVKARVWRRLLFRVSSDKMGASVEQLQIVYDSRIVRLKRRGLEKFLAGGLEIAPQHIRIALIIKDIDGLPYQLDRLRIGPIGEVEPADAVVTGGKTYPCSGISRRPLYRVLEVALGHSVVSRIKMLDRQPQRLIGGIIFDVARLFDC